MNLLILVVHQLLYQGMFVAKNLLLKKKLGKSIRGKNREATVAILFFVIFIGLSLAYASKIFTWGYVAILPEDFTTIIATTFLISSLLIALLALIGLRDSWRVGVQENQKTELITSGIYAFSRNPYFVSYLLLFAGYTILLSNLVLLGLSIIGFISIHMMILKEEEYLRATHGEVYIKYCEMTARYLLF